MHHLVDYLNGALKRGTYNPQHIMLAGVVGLIGHPLYWAIWVYLFPQPYESPLLRFSSAAICLPLVLIKFWPARLKPLLPAYWHFAILYVLPFTFTYLILHNDYNLVWLLCYLVMIALVMQLIPETLLFIIILVVGSLAGATLFVAEEGFIPFASFNLEYIPVVLFMLFVGMFFQYLVRTGIRDVERERSKIFKALSGSIAHEMRNPLGQVRHQLNRIGHKLPAYHPERPVESLDERALDQLYEGVAHGQMAVKRGVQIIDMILDQVHDKPIDPERFVYLSAARTTRKALAEYGYDSPAEQERVHLDVGEDFDFRVDETLYLFVLFNLLKNALYYFRHRSTGEIFLRLERGESHNRLHFKDTGPGIPKENLDRLFDGFFTAGKQGGTGLGLAYCKRVMRAFGGEITCDSVLGEFTEFTLTFPLVDQAEFDAYNRRIMEEVRPLVAGKRLLLVDDEALHRMNVRAVLEPLQVTIDEASNGKEAIARVQGEKYDLILMDLNMPEMNGYEATERLRAGEGGHQGQTTPIVAYTGEPPYIAQGKTEKVGMQGLLAKPCTPPELLVAVGDYLKRGPLAPPQALAGKRVLVVDDAEFNRLIVKEVLEREGIEMAEAAEGEAAIAVLEGHPCELVLMDIQMPGMDGLEATRRIRARRTVPIIGLSGESEAEQIRAAREAGMDDYLVKPIEQAVLLQKVGEWLAAAPLPAADQSPASLPTAGTEADEPPPGFDFDRGAQRLGMDRKRLAALFPTLLRDYEDVPRQVRAALAGGDYQAIQGWAHKIKGTYFYLGADQLHAQAKALERRIEEAGKAPAEEIEGFAEASQRTLDALRRICQEAGANN